MELQNETVEVLEEGVEVTMEGPLSCCFNAVAPLL